VSGKEGENGLAAIAEGFASDSADELVVDVSNGGIAPEVARRIDGLFADRKIPTVTQSARDATRELERSLQDVFRFIDVLSAAILVVIAFVVALTIAFATRERTTDYAVLRALGFSPSHVVTIVAAEALFVCAVGSVLGAVIAAGGALALGSVLADAMPELVPSYGFSVLALLVSVVAASAICVLAAIVPALSAARVEAAVALRTQE
jgi:putative ABC transport system permease protein